MFTEPLTKEWTLTYLIFRLRRRLEIPLTTPESEGKWKHTYEEIFSVFRLGIPLQLLQYCRPSFRPPCCLDRVAPFPRSVVSPRWILRLPLPFLPQISCERTKKKETSHSADFTVTNYAHIRSHYIFVSQCDIWSLLLNHGCVRLTSQSSTIRSRNRKLKNKKVRYSALTRATHAANYSIKKGFWDNYFYVRGSRRWNNKYKVTGGLCNTRNRAYI